MPDSLITHLPRLQVVLEKDMPCSGSAHWTGQHWLISLNASEPPLRQRFSLFHEYKHIVDHPMRALLYPPGRRASKVLPEQLADYFAGCVLMPKRFLKQLYCEGHSDLEELSSIFMVSTRALEVRLHQLGLRDLAVTCRRPPMSTGQGATYYRLASSPAFTGAAA